MHKKQNRVEEYKELFAKMKERGILTFTGIMLALDEDTPEYYQSMPERLEEIDPSAILLSIAIPIPGTPFHERVKAEGRLVDEDLSHYEGDHLVIRPKHVTREQVFEAFRTINSTFYSPRNIIRRWWRIVKGFRERNPFRWLFRMGVATAVFIELSVFQKDHAEQRVYVVDPSSRE